MGRYINRGNASFREILNSEYVDKTGLIGVVNRTLFTRQKFSCVTRCRRFGKSMAAEMLAAYYDISCQSRELFEGLAIQSDETFEQHLNKYPVIYLDITRFITLYKGDTTIINHIKEELMADIAEAYPQVEHDDDDDFMSFMIRIANSSGQKFVFIIDEWDAICREFQPGTKVMNEYVDWLRNMFKGVEAVDVFAGVYMTGILPIKKYDTQSALNNFLEYSMVTPRQLAPFYGFTREEVHALAAKYQMDFEELEKWYDGYQIGAQPSMFNPSSVIQAVTNQWCESFWSTTGAFDTVATYIKMNYEGLQDDIIDMLAGGRCPVRTMGFSNDMHEVNSRDDVLTLLIHLGYLSYDRETRQCYLPNREVADELESAVRANHWKPVVEAVQHSDRLLQALLRGNAEAVAHGVETIHRQEVNLFKYNDENSLACVISLAFYAARNDFHVHREYQTGDGYADLVLIPRKNVAKPAVIIELKYDDTAETAISQIHQRHYPERVEEYSGDLLLVGITYDRKNKIHTCLIERVAKH